MQRKNYHFTTIHDLRKATSEFIRSEILNFRTLASLSLSYQSQNVSALQMKKLIEHTDKERYRYCFHFDARQVCIGYDLASLRLAHDEEITKVECTNLAYESFTNIIYIHSFPSFSILYVD